MNIHNLITQSKDNRDLLTIEATVITGFEFLALEECRETCKPLMLIKAKGRIFFNVLASNFDKVLSLRSVDNIFLVAETVKEIKFEGNKDEDLNLIKSLVDIVDWEWPLSRWKDIVEFNGIIYPLENEISQGNVTAIADSLNKTEISSPHKIEPTEDDEGSAIKEKVNGGNSSGTEATVILSNDKDCSDCSKEANTNIREPSVINSTTSCAHSEPSDEPLSKDELQGESNDVDNENGNESCQANADVTESASADMLKSEDETVEKSKGDDVSSLTETNTANRQKSVSNRKQWQTKRNNEKQRKGKFQRGAPPRRTKPEANFGTLKFRATCYRVGDKHSFSSMEAACEFGGTLQDKFGWTVNLTQYDLNVILNVEKNQAYICVPLTNESLHRRNITHFSNTTLRATMCYNLIRLAEPVTGEIVIDPLCGGGSIPIEGCLSFPYTYQICGDYNEKAVERTRANIGYLNKRNELKIGAVLWNAKSLPLRPQCVDVLVSDLPFGKRSGCAAYNQSLYSKVLYELAKVIKTGTGRACLLTNDKTAFIRALRSQDSYWREIRQFGVNQGGLFSTVFLLLRRAKPVTEVVSTPSSNSENLIEAVSENDPESSTVTGNDKNTVPASESIPVASPDIVPESTSE